MGSRLPEWSTIWESLAVQRSTIRESPWEVDSLNGQPFGNRSPGWFLFVIKRSAGAARSARARWARLSFLFFFFFFFSVGRRAVCRCVAIRSRPTMAPPSDSASWRGPRRSAASVPRAHSENRINVLHSEASASERDARYWPTRPHSQHSGSVPSDSRRGRRVHCRRGRTTEITSESPCNVNGATERS